MKHKEEKYLRLETELRHLLESLAILLSTPVRFVESQEASIKEKVRDVINELKEKSLVSLFEELFPNIKCIYIIKH